MFVAVTTRAAFALRTCMDHNRRRWFSPSWSSCELVWFCLDRKGEPPIDQTQRAIIQAWRASVRSDVSRCAIVVFRPHEKRKANDPLSVEFERGRGQDHARKSARNSRGAPGTETRAVSEGEQQQSCRPFC